MGPLIYNYASVLACGYLCAFFAFLPLDDALPEYDCKVAAASKDSPQLLFCFVDLQGVVLKYPHCALAGRASKNASTTYPIMVEGTATGGLQSKPER